MCMVTAKLFVCLNSNFHGIEGCGQGGEKASCVDQSRLRNAAPTSGGRIPSHKNLPISIIPCCIRHSGLLDLVRTTVILLRELSDLCTVGQAMSRRSQSALPRGCPPWLGIFNPCLISRWPDSQWDMAMLLFSCRFQASPRSIPFRSREPRNNEDSRHLLNLNGHT